jgi:hypothetical protein
MEINDPAFYTEYRSLMERMMRGELTNYEYCKIADDLLIAYTNIRWPLHLNESYAKLPPLKEGEDDYLDTDIKRRGWFK